MRYQANFAARLKSCPDTCLVSRNMEGYMVTLNFQRNLLFENNLQSVWYVRVSSSQQKFGT